VTELRAGLPTGLDFWFERALAIYREHRFRSCAEMTRAFAEALEPPRDTPLSVEIDTPAKHPRWGGTAWKTIGAIAALAYVLVAVHSEIAARSAHAAHATPSAMATMPVAAPAPNVTARAPRK
jgi:hypothetical protein